MSTGTSSQQVTLPDGRNIGLVTTGAPNSNGHTVLFEAGLGGGAASWSAVQRELDSQARTIAYDRAGIGLSTPDRSARTLTRLAQDLNDLLTAAGEHEPVILVGHSWGGAILRAFAAAEPQRIAAIVLVDATISAVVKARQARANQALTTILATVAPLGLHRPLLRAALSTARPALTKSEHALLLRQAQAPSTLRTAAREAAQISSSLPHLRALEEHGLPNVPVTTVVGSLAKGSFALAMRELLRQHATAEMQRHPHGRFVAATGSGHHVPFTEPHLVAHEIAHLMGRVEAARPSAPRQGATATRTQQEQPI